MGEKVIDLSFNITTPKGQTFTLRRTQYDTMTKTGKKI